jgi:hypothetical protein
MPLTGAYPLLEGLIGCPFDGDAANRMDTNSSNDRNGLFGFKKVFITWFNCLLDVVGRTKMELL